MEFNIFFACKNNNKVWEYDKLENPSKLVKNIKVVFKKNYKVVHNYKLVVKFRGLFS